MRSNRAKLFTITLISMSTAFVSYGQTRGENSDIDAEMEDMIIGDFEEKSAMKFEPIPVDKEDGFYATVDYTYSPGNKNIQLEDAPSLSSKDILEIKKVYNEYTNSPEISIVLTKDGTRKFSLLTKENIGKPIAIVIDHKIVSLPTIQAEISGGQLIISGGFSEKEVDKMIEKLKGV
ncbi:hypothetical protein GCM10009122_00110 [Fulvivirga kasyanovii]|uniref:SecDF P1 head subdomain-containing protein n=1 Tax=Fulvivirga kasyanovii TaxID=396812 RepID=UPI0031CE3FFF